MGFQDGEYGHLAPWEQKFLALRARTLPCVPLHLVILLYPYNVLYNKLVNSSNVSASYVATLAN